MDEIMNGKIKHAARKECARIWTTRRRKRRRSSFTAGVETKQPTQRDGGRACKNPTWPKKQERKQRRNFCFCALSMKFKVVEDNRK
jgi:hypothetical protein